MKSYTTYLAVGLIIVIIVVISVFALTTQRTTDGDFVTVPAGEENPGQNTNQYGVERIEAKYFFKNGIHTIAGSLLMPTPCDAVAGQAMVAESMPEQVTIAFTVTNTAALCAQVITEQPFKIAVAASKDASIRATFMGEPVALNLIPAQADESPEDFDLYRKE